MSILHAWTVNSANRLVKNPKTHFSNPTPVTFSHPRHKQVVKNAKIDLSASLLACDVDGKMLGLDENGLLYCIFESLANLFTEFTVHACNMFTRLKLM